MAWDYLWDMIKRLGIVVLITALVCGIGLLRHRVKDPDRSQASYDVEYDDIEWYNTERSTAFSSIGFDKNSDRLYVVFRNSGKAYLYENFSEGDFAEFIEADSLGSYYNQNIKGEYPSSRCPDYDE